MRTHRLITNHPFALVPLHCFRYSLLIVSNWHCNAIKVLQSFLLIQRQVVYTKRQINYINRGLWKGRLLTQESVVALLLCCILSYIMNWPSLIKCNRWGSGRGLSDRSAVSTMPPLHQHWEQYKSAPQRLQGLLKIQLTHTWHVCLGSPHSTTDTELL